MSRTLAELAALVGGSVQGDGTIRVSDLTHDSRAVGPDTLFVAIVGATHDGHEFAAQAVASGAPALCVSRAVNIDVSQLIVGDTRSVAGPLAATIHDNPSEDVDIVGITGTNGKTTVAHYIESIAGYTGRLAGVIGTIETRLGSTVYATERTTPEAPRFQRLLGQMRDEGAEIVAVEVSSHALEMGRVKGTSFAVAAFTNLSRDHLDFHGSMSEYQKAKQRLFEEYRVGVAVVNVDDPVGAEIALGFGGSLLTVGQGGSVSIAGLKGTASGSEFTLATPEGEARVAAPVLGEFNVNNAVMAAASCLALGIQFDEVVAGLGHLKPVPGRLEVLAGPAPFTVVVDYAHTPDGIESVIEVARTMTAGRVIAVAGAGGDRDREKRPLMGQAVSQADVAIVTSDNPRSEEPDQIIASMVSEIDGLAHVVVEPDRRTAIERAISGANDGDVVLVLGRGHEPVQEFAKGSVPFDDRIVVREVLSAATGATESRRQSGSMRL